MIVHLGFIKTVTGNGNRGFSKANLPSFTWNTSICGPLKALSRIERTWNHAGRFHVHTTNHKMIATSFKVESIWNCQRNIFVNCHRTFFVVAVLIGVVAWPNTIIDNTTVTFDSKKFIWKQKRETSGKLKKITFNGSSTFDTCAVAMNVRPVRSPWTAATTTPVVSLAPCSVFVASETRRIASPWKQ